MQDAHINNAYDDASVLSLGYSELEALVKGLGQPAFRAAQLFSWLHDKRVTEYSDMQNLPQALRTQLAQQYTLPRLIIKRKQTAQDGTVKYLFELPDGRHVETVLMRYRHGTSLCISTQVGCRMGCGFCASTMAGLARNLTPGEMLLQVYEAVRDSGLRVDSLVLMGMGEPLDNFENVIKFIEILTHEKGYNLGMRHISLSTCGLVPQIERLMEHSLQLTLSVSLHATDNATRSAIMPINNKYPLDELMAACRRYAAHTRRRVSFEYALIAGVNDTVSDAAALGALLKGMLCHVNLIPLNPVEGRDYKKSSGASIAAFVNELSRHGVVATVRRELGGDISAACGQLRRQTEGKQPDTTN